MSLWQTTHVPLCLAKTVRLFDGVVFKLFVAAAVFWYSLNFLNGVTADRDSLRFRNDFGVSGVPGGDKWAGDSNNFLFGGLARDISRNARIGENGRNGN